MCLSHKSLKEYGIKKVVNKNNEVGVVLSFDNDHIIVKYPNDEKTYKPDIALKQVFLLSKIKV